MNMTDYLIEVLHIGAEAEAVEYEPSFTYVFEEDKGEGDH